MESPKQWRCDGRSNDDADANNEVDADDGDGDGDSEDDCCNVDTVASDNCC